eukprot:CAMPEP_0114537258 /NCGR_PEP_ID=MMETSP0109-20121206/29479_1 /TAXON_ID=29199 /ORGANISM="Chlorarachnion reptans, Strain CCCM449" /LENGTH=61 /DNA_ID=CAMNT_0001721129 /DNA_START=316 /DNA_END=501 /DNA_ORIENTATION=+
MSLSVAPRVPTFSELVMGCTGTSRMSLSVCMNIGLFTAPPTTVTPSEIISLVIPRASTKLL